MDNDNENEIMKISDLINGVLNKGLDTPKYGFIFLSFEFNVSPLSLTYVSNTQREGAIHLLKYQATTLENEEKEEKTIEE